MALAYRAYFAFIQRPLKNSKGENTSAVFGFANSLIKILDEEKPDYIAAVFDTKEPTFRHKQYAAYKATREKMPEDMIPQLHFLKELAIALGVTVIEFPGYEADDIIATLALRAAKEDHDVFMVTGDKDFMQLITPRILIYNPLQKKSENPIVNADSVREKFGVNPDQIIDLLALMGDTADNIPGVKGIGEKTAMKLIQEFGSFDNLYARVDEVKGKVRENLIQYRDNAILSKSLVTIDVNVPVDAEISSLTPKEKDLSILIPMLQKLEFGNLVKKFAPTDDLFGDAPVLKTALPDSYKSLTDKKALDGFCESLKHCKTAAFEIMLSSENAMGAELTGIAIATKPGHSQCVLVNETLSADEIIKSLKPFFENSKLHKWTYDLKRAALFLKRYDIALMPQEFDITVAAFCWHGERDISLPTLATEFLGESIPETSSISDTANLHADVSLRVREPLGERMTQDDAQRIFSDLELPLLPVLTEMEFQGVHLNLDILAEMSVELGKQITVLETDIYSESGIKFNINSGSQLGEILFDKLQIHKHLSIEKPKRTGKTKQYATDVKILEMYRGLPIVDAMLQYRQLTKLKSTYIDGLPPLLNPRTQRIHSTFSQTVAATGRLSSRDPNFQNIPIRSEMGREIRKTFTPQLADWKLLSADYSQIELRVMAHLSEDENLIEAFMSDQDIHTSTAARVFGVDPAKVDSDLRRKAKEVNFGVIYGISPFGLAQRIGMPQTEAKAFIQNYFETYPKVKTCIEKIISDAHAHGYVTTLYGRRRYLPEINSKNYPVRQFAERAATNTPVQGTAAEIIKFAMIRLYDELRKNNFKAKMILQVHDELVFECPVDEITALKELVRTSMENAVSLRVPLKVDMGVGDNWLEAK